MNRRNILLILVLTLAAGSYLLYRFYTAPAGGRGNYLFIFVWETNSHALDAIPLGGLGDHRAAFDESTRSLYLSLPEDLPGPNTRVVIFYLAEALALPIRSEVYQVEAIPFTLPLKEPLVVEGSGFDQEGRPAGTVNVVNNERRLLRGNLELVSLDEGGRVEMLYGGQGLTLEPGKGWEEVLVQKGQKVSVVPEGDGREREITEAFRSGAVITRLSIYNYGWWPKSRARSGDGLL